MRIVSRRIACMVALPVVVLALLAVPAEAADKVLAHDDGERAGKQSASGTGHVVDFEAPKGEWWIRSVRIHGSRYGGGYDPKEVTFTVAICDEALRPLVTCEAPYAHFSMGQFAWAEVELPRVIQVPRAFRVVVAFDPAATRGVYVGWSKTTESHSAYGLAGGSARPAEDGRAWMIRPVLTKKPPRGAVKELVLAHDDGEMGGKQSLGGGAHVVEFKKPSGTWWIESVRVHGSRYGGRYDPKTTTLAVDIASPRMKSLYAYTVPYASFPFGEFAWVDLPLTEPQKAPSKFRVIVDFDSGATKGVYLGWSATSSASSYTGRAGENEGAWNKGAWMIRVRLVSEKPVALVEATPAGRDPKIYVRDFEYIQRTVREKFPALEKKGVDWKVVCAEWKPRFAACKDDETHVLNARRLLAVLSDSHTGLTKSKVEAHAPHWDGLYGAGMWIATEGGHHVLHSLQPGHPLESRLTQGALLVAIDGRPASTVHEEVRRRLRTWSGWSSTHFLDARLSFQFFSFGDKQTLPARFVNPDGEVIDVDLPRWGPGGRGLSRAAVTVPEGVAASGLAVSKRLTPDLGYVRILGGMNEETRRAFFEAFDALQGVKGILLDCRGMGGGGDHAAWALAGRFFAERTRLKHDPALKPTGDWQFTGPVVMLQDERMMSSAETFTWSMAETGRVVTVGRPTGGATIIPRSFEVPSKMFGFRMGVHDRETSVDGVQSEGIGSPPHVYVPYCPALFARAPDPVRAIGLDVLRYLVTGAERDVVVGTYDSILAADPARVAAVLDAWRAIQPPDGLLVRDLATDLVGAMGRYQRCYLEADANEVPDEAGVRCRLDRLAAVAKVLGLPEAD